MIWQISSFRIPGLAETSACSGFQDPPWPGRPVRPQAEPAPSTSALLTDSRRSPTILRQSIRPWTQESFMLISTKIHLQQTTIVLSQTATDHISSPFTRTIPPSTLRVTCSFVRSSVCFVGLFRPSETIGGTISGSLFQLGVASRVVKRGERLFRQSFRTRL